MNGKMKSKGTKRNFSKFTVRNKHKRRAKERAIAELSRAVEELNISAEGAVLGYSTDSGRRGRVTSRRMKDEETVRGIFQSSRSGFGFVVPLDDGASDRDIFIPEDKCRGALHGDLVEAVFHRYTSRLGEEKTEGRVVKIIEYGLTTVVGTLMHEPSYMRGKRRIPSRWYVLPDDSRVSVRPEVDDPADAVEGDKVLVKLRRSEAHPYGAARGQIVATFGDTMSRSANYEAILAECGIPVDFSPEELAEADAVAAREIDRKERCDLTDLTVMTIDGEDAKDLDDAISIRKLSTGWRLYVHIADVSSYIDEKSALDRAVMARGTSVYFVDKVVPMLPPALSNGACSLNAGEPKAALSAIMTLDDEGEILRTEIVPSVIVSRVRGVYSEVNSLLSGEATAQIKKKYAPVRCALGRMQELYQILARRSERRGAMELDAPEARIIIGQDGEPTDIVRRERGVSERMIEQFMLLANEAVATLLNGRGIPCVYRVHAEPPTEKLEGFLEYVHGLGFDTSYISARKCEPSDFSRLLSAAAERGLGEQISYTMLRAMAKAEYSATPARHFGLGIELYCHFTSPIRRLSDLATHRIIHKVLLEGKRPAAYASYSRRVARAATDAEVRAVGAERRIEDLYKVIFMSDRVGEIFDGAVCSVTGFGMFVVLDNTCEGLVPMSELPGLFTFDERHMTLRCGSLVYSLGDRVRVRLEEADVIRGKLRFSVCL